MGLFPRMHVPHSVLQGDGVVVPRAAANASAGRAAPVLPSGTKHMSSSTGTGGPGDAG